MSFPQLTVPTHTLLLPVSNTTVTYRPYLVKEEKILLMAVETLSTKGREPTDKEIVGEFIPAILRIINNCVSEDIDIENIPYADIEYLFLKIVIASNGETRSAHPECKSCSIKNKITINLNEIEIDTTTNYDKLREIELENTNGKIIGIKLNYPSYKTIINPPTDIVENMINHINYIYDSTTTYKIGENTTHEEIVKFVEGFNKEQQGRIKKFFDSNPRLEKTIKYDCEKCGEKNVYKMSGMGTFFA